MRLKQVDYHPSVLICGRIFVHGRKNRVRIGGNSTLISSPTVNPTSGFAYCHLRVENDGFIHIGKNVGISHANITAFVGVTIEDNVLIGSGVKIWDTDFHSINFEDRINLQDKSTQSSHIHVKEGVFIGACTLVLKGVTVGKNSVVGAGSVVTKDIPDNEVWAGNPARKIKNVGSTFSS